MDREIAFPRLTLALAMAGTEPAAAQMVIALAARLGVALEMLLFEEGPLLRAAEEQLVQLLTAPHYRAEKPGRESLAAALRLQETQLRRSLEAGAKAAGVGFSFRIVADEPADAPLGLEAGIVAVPNGGLVRHRRDAMRRLAQDATGLLLLPPGLSAMARPAVLLDRAIAGDGAIEFLRFAGAITRRLVADAAQEMDVLLAGPSTETGPQHRLEAALAGSGIATRLHVRRAGDDTRLDLPGAIDALIIPAQDLLAESIARHVLIDTLRVPMLLLRWP